VNNRSPMYRGSTPLRSLTKSPLVKTFIKPRSKVLSTATVSCAAWTIVTGMAAARAGRVDMVNFILEMYQLLDLLVVELSDLRFNMFPEFLTNR
jgi:hypothetical protein